MISRRRRRPWWDTLVGHGAQEIAFIAGSGGSPTGVESLAGYREAARSGNGIPVQDRN